MDKVLKVHKYIEEHHMVRALFDNVYKAVHILILL